MSYLETLKTGKIPEKKPKNKKLTPYDKFVMNKRPQTISGAARTAVTSPTNYNDVRILIEELKRNRGVMVDFSVASPVRAQRLLDYLSGAVYALGGRIEKVRGAIYLVMPVGMEIVCTQPDELSKKR